MLPQPNVPACTTETELELSVILGGWDKLVTGNY